MLWTPINGLWGKSTWYFLQIIRVCFASKSCVQEITHHSVCPVFPELKRAEALRAVVWVLHPKPGLQSYGSTSLGSQQRYNRLLQKLSLKKNQRQQTISSLETAEVPEVSAALDCELGRCLVTIKWTGCRASKKAVRGVALQGRGTSWPRTEQKGLCQRQWPSRELEIMYFGKAGGRGSTLGPLERVLESSRSQITVCCNWSYHIASCHGLIVNPAIFGD